MSSEGGMKCPKDGSELTLIYEAEKLGDSARVLIYYKCPVCGYKKDSERLELKRVEQGILLKRFLYP